MTPNRVNYYINSDLDKLWDHVLNSTYNADSERFCRIYLAPFLCDRSPYFRTLLTPKAEQFLIKHQASATQDLVKLLHSLMKSKNPTSIDSKT